MNSWPYLVLVLLALVPIVIFWAASRPPRRENPPQEPFRRSDVDVRR